MLMLQCILGKWRRLVAPVQAPSGLNVNVGRRLMFYFEQERVVDMEEDEEMIQRFGQPLAKTLGSFIKSFMKRTHRLVRLYAPSARS